MKNVKIFLLTKSIGGFINVLSYVAPKKAFELAYRFFSRPRSGRLKSENLPSILSQSQLETIEVNGQQVQTYLWPGNETVVLLLHGWESNSARWEKLLPTLSQTGFTIVAIDAPAHGLTHGIEYNVPLHANFAMSVIDKYRPQHIIGHSMGGMTAMYLQHHYAIDHLEKVVLLGAPSDFEVILNNYLKLLSLNDRIKRRFYEYTRERFKVDIVHFTGQNFLKTATTAGIIIHDTEDTVVLFQEAEKLAGSWKSGQLLSTSGLGHSLHDEEVHQQIVSFLKGA